MRVGIVTFLQSNPLLGLLGVVGAILGYVPLTRKTKSGLVCRSDKSSIVRGDVQGGQIEQVSLSWKWCRVVQATVTDISP